MNLYVCIKQVPNTEIKIKLTPQETGVDLTGAKWILSPYDEIAIEEALCLKDKNPKTLVTVLSVGPLRVQEALRSALAMGADSAIHIEAPETIDQHLIAKILASVLKQEPQIDLVFTGKESIDTGAAQVSQLLATHLEMACITVVKKIIYQEALPFLLCHREVEGGTTQVLQTPFPALIAVQKGLNQPRYTSIPNLMKAKKKEIRLLKMEDTGVSLSEQKIRYQSFQLPPQKQAGKKLTGNSETQVQQLVTLLHEEAKVV